MFHGGSLFKKRPPWLPEAKWIVYDFFVIYNYSE
jgi:hypothetical protein